MSTATNSSAHDVPYPITVDEGLGERLQENEGLLATKIANTIEAGIHRQYTEGNARRDVHAKATGVVKAEFRVHDDIPANLAKGVFVPGKVYQALLRFSNATGDPSQSDNHDDGRGLAVKLLNVPGEKLLESDRDAKTQDFVLINQPIFFTNSSKAYLSLFEKLAGGPLDKLTIPFALGLKGSLIAQRLGAGKIANPLQLQYFSAVPYQLGQGPERQAIKFSIKPTSSTVDPLPSNPDANYLHQAFKASLAKGDVSFKFMIQPKTKDHMDVEDSMTEWSQAESPFQEVATITIPQQDVDSEEIVRLGERLSFNPWHSLPDHRPLGSINRTRKIVYERISRVRDSMNHVPRQEPS